MAQLTPAQKEHLIGLQRNDRLTPDEVVEDARAETSVLHDLFEWRDSVAANAHRVQTARALIREVQVLISVERFAVQIPRYVRDPESPPRVQGYVAVTAVDDAERQRQIVSREVTAALGSLDRAARIALALGYGDDLLAMRDKLKGWVSVVGGEGETVDLRGAAD